jgi:hypothetical protein
LTAIPYTLKTLEIYTLANIQESIEQLDEEMQKLGVEDKLEKNLSPLKDLFVLVKKAVGSHPSIDLLFSHIRTTLIYKRGFLEKIMNEEAFEKLKMIVNEQKAYDILAWGIIKYYLKIELGDVPHPSIHIIYDK